MNRYINFFSIGISVETLPFRRRGWLVDLVECVETETAAVEEVLPESENDPSVTTRQLVSK